MDTTNSIQAFILFVVENDFINALYYVIGSAIFQVLLFICSQEFYFKKKGLHTFHLGTESLKSNYKGYVGLTCNAIAYITGVVIYHMAVISFLNPSVYKTF